MSPSHPSNCPTIDTLSDLFSYHPPRLGQVRRYSELRSFAREFAHAIFRNCPPSADRDAALRKVREALMTANAAIALELEDRGAPSFPMDKGPLGLFSFPSEEEE
ncbi:MAG: hypothetical protein AAGN66_05570 [Acidobacteriota bacterium]